MECVCCYRPRGLCIIKVRAVHISGTKSGMFSVDVGLHQGWTLSLILFVIFIDSWGGSGIKLRCFMGCSLWRFSNHARLGRDLRVGPEHLTLLESLVAFSQMVPNLMHLSVQSWGCGLHQWKTNPLCQGMLGQLTAIAGSMLTGGHQMLKTRFNSSISWLANYFLLNSKKHFVW